MKIDIRKGYFLRCLFTANMYGISFLIFGIVMLIWKSDTIAFLGTLIIYAAVLAISSFVSAIIIYKKFEYHYIFLDDDFFSLVNKKGSFIDFEDSFLFIDNPVVGILLSIFDLFFQNELKYDFRVYYKKIECVKVCLTIRQYFKIKKSKFKYIEFL